MVRSVANRRGIFGVFRSVWNSDFQLGSAEPKGSASICQGFCGLSKENEKNSLTCKITSEQAIEVLSTKSLVPN